MDNRGTRNTCRLTTACSELDHHKVHAPYRHRRFEVSDCAPSVRRPVADAGRWATLPQCHIPQP
jgi:hypothetical protein